MRLPGGSAVKASAYSVRPGFDPSGLGYIEHMKQNICYKQTNICHQMQHHHWRLKRLQLGLKRPPEHYRTTLRLPWHCRVQNTGLCNSEPGSGLPAITGHHRHTCHNCPLTTGWWMMACCPGSRGCARLCTQPHRRGLTASSQCFQLVEVNSCIEISSPPARKTEKMQTLAFRHLQSRKAQRRTVGDVLASQATVSTQRSPVCIPPNYRG